MRLNYRQLLPLGITITTVLHLLSLHFFTHSTHDAPIGHHGNVVSNTQLQFMAIAPTFLSHHEPDIPQEQLTEVSHTMPDEPRIKEEQQEEHHPDKADQPESHATAGLGGSNTAPPSYIEQVLIRLHHYKQYPQRAQRRGITGTVTLYLKIDIHGTLTDYQIVKSSGHPLLDHSVITMVERAKPFSKPDLPQGQTFVEITVPIVFELNEYRHY